MTTYSVWMEIPTASTKKPFSRIAGNLTEEEADVYRRTLHFPARIMPDHDETGTEWRT